MRNLLKTMKKPAMILAAGLGTRLRPYTNIQPKPLFPVLGQPLLLITLQKLRKSGFSPIIVNTHHLGAQIVELLKNENDVILQQEETILGTGGGLRMAMENFGNQPVLVTNGDIYHDIDFQWVFEEHQRSGCPVSMVMHDLPRFNKVSVAENHVVGFGQNEAQIPADADFLAFTGVHVIEPQILAPLPENASSNIIDRYKELLVGGQKIKAMKVEDHYWKDMGTPDDYLDLHAELLSSGLMPPGTKGQRRGRFWADKDAVVGNYVRMEDWTVIGAGAQIGDGAVLKRVVVWDGAVVEAGAEVSDVIIC